MKGKQNVKRVSSITGLGGNVSQRDDGFGGMQHERAK